MLLSFVAACVLVLRCCERVCVLYVSFWCAAMGRAVLFILRSRLLLHSAVNRVQVVLSGFSVNYFG